MSRNIEETDTSDITDEELDVDLSVDITWEDTAETWEVVSEQPGGFDTIVRPDYKSAKSAAEIHERATGNFADIRLL